MATSVAERRHLRLRRLLHRAGRTQNSVYPDNCTFWFSNDPAGIVFDGQNLTPEMAFGGDLDDTPVPVELMSISVE